MDNQKTDRGFVVKEGYIEKIINSMVDALFVINADTTILFVNKATEDLLGYRSDELVGKAVGTIIVEEDIEFFRIINDLIRMGSIKDYDILFLTKSGDKIPMSFNGSLIRDERMRLQGIVGIARDMREVKRLIDELERARILLEERVKERTSDLESAKEEIEKAYNDLKNAHAQLLQADKMASIGQLAAGVAHEMNNPIGFINSNLGSLKEYIDDLTLIYNEYKKIIKLVEEKGDTELISSVKEIREMEERIDIDFVLEDIDKIIEESQDGTDRVKNIIMNLKDFSHIDQAEIKYADINKCLDSTINIVWNELKYKAEVIKEYGDIPEIRCYPQQVNQVFLNIIVNASHAISDRGEIRIKTYQINKEIIIEISDTGSGIPEENIKRIFEPFFTTKGIGKGTGLGLSIAYNIIERHKGRIDVKSEMGKGTTFRIVLPIK